MKLHLGLNPLAARLARRGRRGRLSLRRRSRWPGWGSLTAIGRRAGGHPGGICRADIAADGLARYPRAPFDLAVRRAALEQRVDRDA